MDTTEATLYVAIATLTVSVVGFCKGWLKLAIRHGVVIVRITYRRMRGRLAKGDYNWSLGGSIRIVLGLRGYTARIGCADDLTLWEVLRNRPKQGTFG